MGCVSNGVPGTCPRPLSIGQTQARVRMVTTHSRIVAHALDLSPLQGTDGTEEAKESPWLKVLAQLGLPNRRVWNQMQMGVADVDVDMGSTVDGEGEKVAASWSSMQQALLSHMGGGWFGRRDQKDGSIAKTNAQSSSAVSASEVLRELSEGQVVMKGDQEEPNKRPQPPDIWRFLKPVPLAEAKMARVMASLSDLTYFVGKVTPANLFKRHKMHLVATSLMCKEVKNEAVAVEDAIAYGDGMAVGQDLTDDTGGNRVEEEEQEEEEEEEMSNIVAAATDDEIDDLVTGEPHAENEATSSKPMWFGTRKVAARMAESMSTAANGIYSQAMAQFAWQMYQALSVGHTAVNVTVSQVLSLVQAALTLGNNKGGQSELSKAGKPPPIDWFVCDHQETNSRVFCVQGSDNFESWQTNLTFNPVIFEDESLGVRIHQGVYGVAQTLYELFAPLVTEFVHENPGAKINMTGHSLGGSLASVLMLMLVHRGVLPAENVGTVYTFGAAACFCEAAACDGLCKDCAHVCPLKPDGVAQQVASKSLLEKLDLETKCIVDVVMSRDIVPRAFACDYSRLAALLRNVGPGFRDLCCLQHDRSLLYTFLGDVLVLQPDIKKVYVNEGEGYHPQLPEGAGLYRITEATEGLKESLGWKRTCPVGDRVYSRREAVLSFLDNPHPLEILGDARAYGESGTISRYHNPMHYKNALGTVVSTLKKRQLDHLLP